MKILKLMTSIIERIISLINIILMLVIIFNLFNLILVNIQDNNYITFLGYTYQIIKEDNNEFNLQKGDFVLIDLNRTPEKGQIILFNNNGKSKLGQVKEISYENLIIKAEDDITITYEQVLGTNIKTIHNLGDILIRLLSARVLITSIIILIFTSIMQYVLNKMQNKSKKKYEKPNFKKFNTPV